MIRRKKKEFKETFVKPPRERRVQESPLTASALDFLAEGVKENLKEKEENRIGGHKKKVKKVFEERRDKLLLDFAGSWMRKNEKALKDRYGNWDSWDDKKKASKAKNFLISTNKLEKEIKKGKNEKYLKKAEYLKCLRREIDKDIVPPETKSLILHELNTKYKELKEKWEETTDSKVLEEAEEILKVRKDFFTLVQGEEEDYFDHDIGEAELLDKFEKWREMAKNYKDKSFLQDQLDVLNNLPDSKWDISFSGEKINKIKYDGKDLKTPQERWEKIEKSSEDLKGDKDSLKRMLEVYEDNMKYEIEFDGDAITTLKTPDGKDLLDEVSGITKKKKLRKALETIKEDCEKNYAFEKIKDKMKEMLGMSKFSSDGEVEKIIEKDSEYNSHKDEIKEFLKNSLINEEIFEKDTLKDSKENVEREYERLRDRTIGEVIKVAGKEKKEIVGRIAERYEEKIEGERFIYNE